MHITIHRGENQIGGNIVEVSTDTTQIIIDIGSELEEEIPVVPDLPDVFERPGVDATILSHYHADHIGLHGFVHPKIPLYIGEKSRDIVDAIQSFYGLPASRFLTYYSETPLQIGDITITPIPVDHSAYDAHMILLEAEGETILYSGDFRGHGRTCFDSMLKKLPREVDVLICEGTALGRSPGQVHETEEELEDRLVEVMNQKTGPVFILCPGTNIDRIITLHKSARRSKRWFLVDLYVALISSAIGKSAPDPVSHTDVRVFLTRGLSDDDQRFKQFRAFGRSIIGKKAIDRTRFAMVVRSSFGSYLQALSSEADFTDGVLVYSMWEGYKARPEMKEFLATCTNLGLDIVSMHTSGHADEETTLKLIRAVQPKRIMPIHTEHAEWFDSAMNENDLSQPIHQI